jgi:hypothetical protein
MTSAATQMFRYRVATYGQERARLSARSMAAHSA